MGTASRYVVVRFYLILVVRRLNSTKNQPAFRREKGRTTRAAQIRQKLKVQSKSPKIENLCVLKLTFLCMHAANSLNSFFSILMFLHKNHKVHVSNDSNSNQENYL